MDMWNNSCRCDCDIRKKLIQFFIISNCSTICLGEILVFLLSLAAFPANSETSTVKYSSTAAKNTGAPAPTLSQYLPSLKNLCNLPTGN
jgi:hypothetical protein